MRKIIKKNSRVNVFKRRTPMYKQLPTNVAGNWHNYEYDIGTGIAGTDGDSINLILSNFTGCGNLSQIYKSFKILSYGIDVIPRSYEGGTGNKTQNALGVALIPLSQDGSAAIANPVSYNNIT